MNQIAGSKIFPILVSSRLASQMPNFLALFDRILKLDQRWLKLKDVSDLHYTPTFLMAVAFILFCLSPSTVFEVLCFLYDK